MPTVGVEGCAVKVSQPHTGRCRLNLGCLMEKMSKYCLRRGFESRSGNLDLGPKQE